MSILFAITDTEQTSEFHWYVSGAETELRPVSAEQLSQIKADRMVLVVSGLDVFFGTVDAVTRSEKQLRDIALFQLEDDLSQPLSSLHVALGGVGAASGKRPVSVVSRHVVNRWVETLTAQLGKAADKVGIVSDCSLLAETGNGVLFDGDGRVLLAAKGRAVAIDPVMANDLVPALLNAEDETAPDYVQGPSSVLTVGSLNLSVQPTLLGYPELISRLLWTQRGIDLRQGEFRSAQSIDIGFVSKWTGTLVLAGLSVAVWLGYLGLSGYQIRSATNELYQSSVASYRAMFPDEGEVVNPLSRVTEKLATSGSAGSEVSATAVLSVFFTAISRTEGVELVSVNFNSSTGRLTSSLRFSGYQDRDRLKQEMERVGLSIELGGVVQEEGFLVGQAVVGAIS